MLSILKIDVPLLRGLGEGPFSVLGLIGSLFLNFSKKGRRGERGEERDMLFIWD